MAAQPQEPFAKDRPPATSPPQHGPSAPRLPSAAEPGWLWESVRYQFWGASDLERSIRHLGPLTPAQGQAVAYWWSLLAAIEGLGPRAYAAAFVRATEQGDSDQVRWSLLAMLRDELQHEQLCRLVLQQLRPRWPLEDHTAAANLGCHLQDAYEQAEQCLLGCRRALDRHGISVVEGGLLLVELATGGLYEDWATTCTIPTFTTAFRHAAHDAQRHQAVMRALAARDWPLLTPRGRAEAAAQVEAAASLLSEVLFASGEGQPETVLEVQARQAGLGVPTGQQRRELLRTALLRLRHLQLRYGIPFPAIPELAIAGSAGSTGTR